MTTIAEAPPHPITFDRALAEEVGAEEAIAVDVLAAHFRYLRENGVPSHDGHTWYPDCKQLLFSRCGFWELADCSWMLSSLENQGVLTWKHGHGWAFADEARFLDGVEVEE